ncbi:hypothetical protein CDV31_002014 [Fusarium ambrosium]|uniref:Uncharacterized protein n=1 Tax=Fusarium ambrosium TaxID=131363 RepID=A0A428UXQ9_9HYPO|nr:hypothetical protein CDV31_002014 [Fusarium ambrosium]
MSNSNISPPEPVYAIVWSIQGEYDVPPPQAFSALGSCHTQGCYVGGVRRGSAHCLQRRYPNPRQMVSKLTEIVVLGQLVNFAASP